MKTKSGEIDQKKMIEGLRGSEGAVIDEFVSHFSRPLFGVILNYTKNPSDAEEILQDTLLKAIRKIDTFREESDLWPWIKRIAINNSIMWLRKHRSKREREIKVDDFGAHFSSDGDHQDLHFKWSIDPEDVVLNTELSGQLYEAIQSLPYDYRVPLVLRDIEGYPVRQIASVLGLKEATAKTRIHRARLFVRERLEKYLEKRS